MDLQGSSFFPLSFSLPLHFPEIETRPTEESAALLLCVERESGSDQICHFIAVKYTDIAAIEEEEKWENA